jgi:hypothetical protein
MGVSTNAALPDGTFANSADAINVILTQEANRIGADIHKATIHTSPWINLIRQSSFPDGMGYTLNTLIYDRALPIKSGALSATPGAVGVNWKDLHLSDVSSGVAGFTDGQTRDTSSTGDEGKATIDFTQVLKSYSLKKAVVESPKINVEDLRYAAHRTDQLRAIMDLLKESVRNSWEDRYRDEYDRLVENFVLCKTSGTAIASDTGTSKQSYALSATALPATTKLGDLDADDSDAVGDVNASISNKVMDDIYHNLVRKGAGHVSYGSENGRPVFSLVCSSEASYNLMTEDDKIRDDIRYNSSKVSDLLTPLGVERSFRGFYHLIDDLTTRYAYVDDKDTFTKVDPYIVTGAKVVPNPLYDSATHEAAYVLVDNVMESLIPQPISGGNGVTFDPVSYKGDYKWTNIPDATINPDGTIGFFRGILASASKPIRTDFGFVIVLKRNAASAA